MKKIVTCLSLAAASLMATAPAMAQTEQQLTDAEKAAIVKAVVPAVFEQVKQISGIDFMSLTQPSIQGVVESPLFFPQMSSLRADKLTPISFKPDSMNLDLNAMNLGDKIPGLPAGLAPMIAKLTKDIKLSFANYVDYNVSVSNRTISTSLPTVIKVSLPALQDLGQDIISVSFNMGQKGVVLPFNSLSVDLTLGKLLASMPTMPIKSGSMISIKEALNTKGTLDYNVIIGENVRALGEQMKNTPNFLINVDMTKLATKESQINASLYGLPVNNPEAKLPMGDATVYANLKSTTGIPADSIILRSYNKELKVAGYKKLTPTFTTDKKNLVLTTTESIRTPEATTWTAFAEQIITMPAGFDGMIKSLTSSLIASVTQNLKAGTEFNYVTTIDSVYYGATGAKLEPKRIMKIDATTTIEAVSMTKQKMTVNIDFLKGAEGTKTMNIKAIAPSDEKTITFEFTPTKFGPEPMAKLYVASDFYGVITDNEVIEEDVEETKIVPSAGNIYVKNGKGEYIIVNMVGKVVATGIITSDEEYITTPNMPNGIYMISIKGEKERTTVKFVK